MSNRPFSVAVTGGIGSGKSYICRQLAEAGFPVFYCDEEARRIIVADADVRQQLTDLIGEELYTPEGVLQKSVLRAWLCRGAENATRVNEIVWPSVANAFKVWVTQQAADVVFMECALLFESGFDRLVHRTVMVDAPDDVRLSRVQQRDNVTLETVHKWMALQMPESEKIARADFVISNDGVTPPNLDGLLQQLLAEASKEATANRSMH